MHNAYLATIGLVPRLCRDMARPSIVYRARPYPSLKRVKSLAEVYICYGLIANRWPAYKRADPIVSRSAG